MEEAGRWPIVVLSQGRPFVQLVVGGGCLDLLPDSWNAPRHNFPLTSTKLPLYLAGGDDGDSDEGAQAEAQAEAEAVVSS